MILITRLSLKFFMKLFVLKMIVLGGCVGEGWEDTNLIESLTLTYTI